MKNNSDKEQNLSKLPFSNHSFTENPEHPKLIVNDEGKIEIVEHTHPKVTEINNRIRENDIQILLDNKSELDKTAIYHGFKDVEDWIEKHKDVSYKDFSTNFREIFPYVHDWVRVKNGNEKTTFMGEVVEPVFKIPARDISYSEYKTGIKKDEVLFEEKYNEMKRKEKMVEEMWDNYPLTTNFTVTEGEPISMMNWISNEPPTEEQIKKANVTMDENNFDQVAKDRVITYIRPEEDIIDMDKLISDIKKKQEEDQKKKDEILAFKKDDLIVFSEKEQKFKEISKENGVYTSSKDLTKEKEEKYKKEMDAFFKQYSNGKEYKPDWVTIEDEGSLNARAKNNKVKVPKHEMLDSINIVNKKEQTKKFINEMHDNKIKETPWDVEKDDYSRVSSEIDAMEERLSNSEGFDEEQIQSIKERIKKFEDRLKEKIKPKTITISNNVHNIIKNYCNFYNTKIEEWVEKTLLERIEENSPKRYAITTEKAKEEIETKYKSLGIRKKLVATDKIIGIFNGVGILNKFKFVGYGLDSRPIYDYIGTDIENDIKMIGCNVEVLPEGHIHTATKYQAHYAETEFDDYSSLCLKQDIDLIQTEPFEYLRKNILEVDKESIEFFNRVQDYRIQDIPLPITMEKELSKRIDDLIESAKRKRG